MLTASLICNLHEMRDLGTVTILGGKLGTSNQAIFNQGLTKNIILNTRANGNIDVLKRLLRRTAKAKAANLLKFGVGGSGFGQ